MKTILVLACACMLLQACPAYATESAGGKTLIAYYSRTGNTRAACEALQKELGADMLEIKDVKSREGGWGFFTAALGTVFGMHTGIEPASPDLSAYSTVLLASPIWAGKLSTAMRTFIAKNSLEGKKVILLTTTNVLEKEGSQNKNREMVRQAGGMVAGYYQITARDIIDGKKIDRAQQQIADDSRKLAPEIKKLQSFKP